MANNLDNKDFAPINVEASDRIPMSSQNAMASTKVVTKTNNTLVTICLIVGIACAGLSGYLFWLNLEHKKTIEDNQQRVVNLENRLSATDEEMGNSTVALQVKVTELSNKTEKLWEQMDKLWASAWRRNQQEIKTMDKELSALDNQVKAFQSETNKMIPEVESSVQQLQTRIDSLNSKLSDQSNELLTLSFNQEEFTGKSEQTNKQIRDLTEKLLLLEKRNTSLLQEIRKLENIVKELSNKTV